MANAEVGGAMIPARTDLRTLIADWRERAAMRHKKAWDHVDDEAVLLDMCADELEAALAPAAPPQEDGLRRGHQLGDGERGPLEELVAHFNFKPPLSVEERSRWHSWIVRHGGGIMSGEPESAPLAVDDEPDEEMIPHAFNPRHIPGEEDIWCADCEYHRDHEIHGAPVPAAQKE